MYLKMNKILKSFSRLFLDLGQKSLKARSKTLALGLVRGNSKKALDAGCREGYYSNKLKDKGYEVTSIDKEVKFKGCIKADLNNRLPFKDGYFDLVWCSEVMQYLKIPSSYY